MAVPGEGGRFLVVFDFDETLVNESSDDAVVRTAPGQVLPDWLRASYREGRYNEQMQRVLAYLAQQGVTESAIRAEIQRIPETPGLSALLDFLRAHARHFDCAVISDANSYFIEAWLQQAGARQLFLEIFTNPAHFDTSGRLVLAPCHAHSCPRCPDNMCKQRILRDFLSRRSVQRRRPYQRVFYVGDGANDVCPCLALDTQDVAFARRDFPMHRLLTSTHTAQVNASVQPWSTGHDVMQHLQRALEER
ncbi:probable phosphatase phospho1 [Alosa sapidissima]|uniref:probable phosphatase phospho1 n=1 Tax=Alosa sapidissima TaxID=34773 RepID=UPI001C080366|nr:probable phosphatase phospho1 [Alosa sapidissima]XP_041943178.1 probable phosphatase phospho1 [Alosa sapidissima]XP_041943179.1 probable phosphatase phospho1 [Alosa sapidissima]XP_041943180.1 probable phosphatase phospho1 [Alosa sapidissima]XP_041943181.1 probable phosphatase phospho1 [Alosa sapidissima]